MRYAVYDASTGEIVGHSEGASAPVLPSGFATFELQPGEPAEGTIVGGERVPPVPAAPDTATVRAGRLEAAKAYRDARQGAGFASAIGRVDTDFERALPLINNMAAAAAGAIAAKTTFPLKKWTLADGSQADLTASKAVAMGAGVIAMLDACQQAYVAVKASLNAAATVAAIAAIDITAGYPA